MPNGNVEKAGVNKEKCKARGSKEIPPREIPLIWSESRYKLEMPGRLMGMECSLVTHSDNAYKDVL